MSEPFVSVVIPHYNDLDNLARCLDCLRRQNWPADRYEIIVADNNSEGGIGAVARIAPDVHVVAAPEQGAGPARNAGAAVARGGVLAFIDSDCLADRDWLAHGVAALRRCDYAGGSVMIRLGSTGRRTPAEAYEAVFAFDIGKYVGKEHYAATGNLFVPKAVFDRVGGFRSGVAEDMDWCWRANALGFRIGYAERAVVGHPPRRRWAELVRKHDRMLRETLWLWRERPGWRRRWLLHALLVGASPIGHWVRVWRSPRLPGSGEKLAGLAGLIAIRAYRCYRMLRLLALVDSEGGPRPPAAVSFLAALWTAALLLAAQPATAQTLYPSGFPADPGFFPIGVWMQPPRDAEAYQAMGINTFVGLWAGPTEMQLAELAKHGMYATATQNETALHSTNRGVIRAWLQADEPDNAQSTGPGKWGACVPAAEVAGETRRLRGRDPTRPVMINFGRGVADDGWWGRGPCTGDDRYYDIAAQGAGILSFDIYPIANVRPALQGKLEVVARGVANLRERATAQQSVWAAIETTKIESDRRATPEQLRSEVWLALMSGASGIYYFVHEWTGGFREDGIFRYPETVAAVTAINRTIRKLAPILNNREAVRDIAIASQVTIRVIAKRRRDALYVFAANMQKSAAPARFVLPGVANTTAEVIDEDRSVHIVAGNLEDSFAGYGVHLYRIPLDGGPPGWEQHPRSGRH
jgi:GT2 family glycosyltransferase